MRKVMLATPAYDGRVECGYTYALVQTIKECERYGIELHPVWWPGEALVQHARNMLVQLAIEAQVDDVLFVDADQEWKPEEAIRLLGHKCDVVGAPVRKKSDHEEYNVRAGSTIPVDEETGLWVVKGIGTGFLRVSAFALYAVWRESQPYSKGNQHCRMVFDVPVIDGQLYGEDTIFCDKLELAGFPILLDPSFVVTHVGTKRYTGSFLDYVRRLQPANLDNYCQTLDCVAGELKE